MYAKIPAMIRFLAKAHHNRDFFILCSLFYRTYIAYQIMFF